MRSSAGFSAEEALACVALQRVVVMQFFGVEEKKSAYARLRFCPCST